MFSAVDLQRLCRICRKRTAEKPLKIGIVDKAAASFLRYAVGADYAMVGKRGKSGHWGDFGEDVERIKENSTELSEKTSDLQALSLPAGDEGIQGDEAKLRHGTGR